MDSTGAAVAAAVEVALEEEVVVVVRRSQGASITRSRSAIQAFASGKEGSQEAIAHRRRICDGFRSGRPLAPSVFLHRDL